MSHESKSYMQAFCSEVVSCELRGRPKKACPFTTVSSLDRTFLVTSPRHIAPRGGLLAVELRSRQLQFELSVLLEDGLELRFNTLHRKSKDEEPLVRSVHVPGRLFRGEPALEARELPGLLKVPVCVEELDHLVLYVFWHVFDVLPLAHAGFRLRDGNHLGVRAVLALRPCTADDTHFHNALAGQWNR